MRTLKDAKIGQSVVVLVTDGRQQMIYKHAISTLAPMKPLKAAAVPA